MLEASVTSSKLMPFAYFYILSLHNTNASVSVWHSLSAVAIDWSAYRSVYLTSFVADTVQIQLLRHSCGFWKYRAQC